MQITIRPLDPADTNWITEHLHQHCGSKKIVSRGRLHNGAHLPGFAALNNDQPTGLLLYEIVGGQCELVLLDNIPIRDEIEFAMELQTRNA